jgi:hypothetical protein
MRRAHAARDVRPEGRRGRQYGGEAETETAAETAAETETESEAAGTSSPSVF